MREERRLAASPSSPGWRWFCVLVPVGQHLFWFARGAEEVVTDLARALRYVIEELFPGAIHNTERYANNRVECDHGRLKARLRPMRRRK